MRINLLISILLLWGNSFSQNKSERSYSQEITLTIDNDIFLSSDWYYTAGHEFSYRKLLKNKSPFAKWISNSKVPSKRIVSFEFGNKIFTPKRTQFSNPINMDRPYAGFQYGSISLSRLKGKSIVSGIAFELGLVGEATGLGKLQQWWHARTGFEEPSGWNSQIANEVVYNMNYQFQKSFRILKGFDLVSTSELFAGTGTNKVSQDLAVRLFEFNPLTESVFSGNRIAYEGNPHKKEVFIFGGLGVDYVLSNIFLEGSLRNSNQSIFTVNPAPWVIRSNVGIMYSANRSSFSLSVNNLSREVAKGSGHSFGRISVSLRF